MMQGRFQTNHYLFTLVTIVSVYFVLFLSILQESLGNVVMDEYTIKNIGPPSLANSNFKIEIIQMGLDFPTKMTFIDDNILVAQKADGKVRVIKNLILHNYSAVDLNVESQWERGLTGITAQKSGGKDYVFL